LGRNGVCFSIIRRILVDNGGKMERSRLRACIGMRYALLNPILEELVREGRIRLTASTT
jgi:predicted transcriptional regulator